MEDHVTKEIRELRRERKEIDASIVDFERMEGRLPAKGKPFGTTSTGKSAEPIPIDRRKRSGKKTKS